MPCRRSRLDEQWQMWCCSQGVCLDPRSGHSPLGSGDHRHYVSGPCVRAIAGALGPLGNGSENLQGQPNVVLSPHHSSRDIGKVASTILQTLVVWPRRPYRLTCKRYSYRFLVSAPLRRHCPAPQQADFCSLSRHHSMHVAALNLLGFSESIRKCIKG
ncbi:hypothetical protein BC567DRAFT_218635 [Phyllosticta citribraziliensis]